MLPFLLTSRVHSFTEADTGSHADLLQIPQRSCSWIFHASPPYSILSHCFLGLLLHPSKCTGDVPKGRFLWVRMLSGYWHLLYKSDDWVPSLESPIVVTGEHQLHTTPQSCPLTPTCVHWHMCAPPIICSTHNNQEELKRWCENPLLLLQRARVWTPSST